MPPIVIAAVAIGAAVTAGAVAGASDKKQTQTSTSTGGIKLNAPTSLQNAAQDAQQADFTSLRDMVNAGPGKTDVTNSLNADRSFASMLSDYSKQGGSDPNAQDISKSQDLAKNLFNPQQVALNQSFVNQTTDANRSAAIMGRDTNDPILAAKLRTNQINQQQMLSANQNAFSTQYAMQQPLQRLGFAQQNAQVLGGLATQAMNNRQSLLATGSGLLNQERQYQLGTSEHYGSSSGEQIQHGSAAGAVSGGLAGLGSGLSAVSGMGAMGGGSGGGGNRGGGGFTGFSTGANSGADVSNFNTGMSQANMSNNNFWNQAPMQQSNYSNQRNPFSGGGQSSGQFNFHGIGGY